MTDYPNLKKWLLAMGILLAVTFILLTIRSKRIEWREEAKSKEPLTNIAASYTFYMSEKDARYLDVTTSSTFVRKEATAEKVVLICDNPGKDSRWKYTMIFNPKTLRGIYRQEYAGTIITGTNTLKPSPQGGYEYLYSPEGSGVSYKAQLIPNWW